MFGGLLFNNNLLMSTKPQVKTLLSRNNKVSEFPMLNNTMSTYSAYEKALEDNVGTIMQKFGSLDRNKVRDLLEELDNNLTLAISILNEENAHCESIISQKKRNMQGQFNLTKDEENKILKQSFLNLYKKLLAKTVELEEMQKKYESQKQQNEKLKLYQRLLIQDGEFNQQNNHNSPSVC